MQNFSWANIEALLEDVDKASKPANFYIIEFENGYAKFGITKHAIACKQKLFVHKWLSNLPLLYALALAIHCASIVPTNKNFVFDKRHLAKLLATLDDTSLVLALNGQITSFCIRKALQSVPAIVKRLQQAKALAFTGIGKAGHIAESISATFASFGVNAYVINAVDAMHGDQGRLQPGTLLVATSKSGQTPELLTFLRYLQKARPEIDTLLIHCNKAVQEGIYIGPAYEFSHVLTEFGFAPCTSNLMFMQVLYSAAFLLAKPSRKQFQLLHPGGAIPGISIDKLA